MKLKKIGNCWELNCALACERRRISGRLPFLSAKNNKKRQPEISLRSQGNWAMVLRKTYGAVQGQNGATPLGSTVVTQATCLLTLSHQYVRWRLNPWTTQSRRPPHVSILIQGLSCPDLSYVSVFSLSKDWVGKFTAKDVSWKVLFGTIYWSRTI